VSFSGSAEWQRVSIDLPVAGNLQHIRIYFPEGAKTVELEHAALRTQSPPRSIHTWQFKSL
jgi:hypothetical protein